ncbi:hypothetical protein LCGC14_0336590 [marine sediment metagenome]|uniref:LITAF domain-containing protein n=1 Tax=marine sediment metagenome TaxID=412755 RepID=A0A0F9TKN0_9ZZZZ
MAGEHAQYECPECGKPTLHTRPLVPFNDILHLLLSAFLCGAWIPFWLLLSASHNKYPEPFRCTQCGHVPGHLPGAITMKQHAASVAAKRTAKIDASIRREQKRRAQEPWRRMRQERRRATKAKLAALARRLPGQVDAAMRAAAGKGNDILYHFFQVALGVVVIGGAVLACYAFLIWPWTK